MKPQHRESSQKGREFLFMMHKAGWLRVLRFRFVMYNAGSFFDTRNPVITEAEGLTLVDSAFHFNLSP